MEHLRLRLCRIGLGVLAVFLAGCGGRAGEAPSGSTQLAAQMRVAPGDSSLPSVTDGYHIAVYAHVDEPMKLSFAPDGALFVGRQPGNRIHRVAPGGASVAEYGPPMVDPDAVLVDVDGVISGARSAVLVGGGGVLAAIYPTQAARVIFNSGFADVDDMKFDRTRRLVFADDAPQLLVSRGSTPTVLLSTPSRSGSIDIDDADRIYAALADGTIRIYNPNGSVADMAFASGLAGLDTYLALGRGAGGFGKALYVLDGSRLLRFNGKGKPDLIGTGFSVGPASGTGFVFGPDHALYVSDYAGNRILRIARKHSD